MSLNQSTETVPMLIYGAARGASTPALNAVATVMVVVTLISVTLAYLVYRWSSRSQPAASGSALNEIAALDI
jgi:spermidine/putrescine transport system permease protein